MRKTIFPLGLCIALSAGIQAQQIDKVITPQAVTQAEANLSSDAMEGRAVFTPAIDRAADTIAARFRSAGLQPLKSGSYFQPFSLLHVDQEKVAVSINGTAIPAEKIAVQTSQRDLDWTGTDSVNVVAVDKDHPLVQAFLSFLNGNKDMLILVDSAGAARLPMFNRRLAGHMPSAHSLVMAAWSGGPVTALQVHIHSRITEKPLKNVVGILPGKSRPNEYVIFSAHYDHLGIGKPDAKGDSIYNGANDDASGTTAVLMLAKYYGEKRDNERTLVFAAFTAEEIGEYGSQYFATQWNPDQVVAMFNIEMIGTTSKWGENSAYITGYERSDFGKILQKNLEGTAFHFYPDPYTEQNLFYRSDNASLAKVGVPAHTISTSKMDSEPYYHKQGDEISTLDMNNMARIIQSIALSASGIISGKDTPTRVDKSTLR